MLVIMAGLPGTGKTTLATAIARRTGAALLNKDLIRAALFSPADIEFSMEQDDFVVEVMLQTAEFLFGKNRGRIVILDGRPFSKRVQLDRVVQFANDLGQTWRILECTCLELTANSRIEADQGTHTAGNRNSELYKTVKANFESISCSKAVIDTDQPLDECMRQALRAMGAG